jgi:glutamate synthase (NADPH/NADH) large chain
VVEGVGDHGCEYMTGGVVVCSARPGATSPPACRGGIAYVLDEAGDFKSAATWPWYLEPVPEEEELLQRIANQSGDLESHGLVDIQGDMTSHDAERLFQLISNHAHYTASSRARLILDNWQDFLPRFVKVMPVDYRRALKEMQAQEADGDMRIGVREGN